MKPPHKPEPSIEIATRSADASGQSPINKLGLINLESALEKYTRVYSLNHPPKGYTSKAPIFFVSTTRPSWHFPVFHVPDAEDAGNARNATTQLAGTDPIFALNILRLSDTQH